MTRNLATLSGILVALNTAVAGDLYKWSDAHGTHYADTPPQVGRSLQRLQVDECADAACERELEHRRRDTMAAYRELEAWLDRRAAQRTLERKAARIEYRSVVLPGPVTVLGHLPRVDTGRLRRHAHRRLPDRPHRPQGRSPGVPAAREPLSVR